MRRAGFSATTRQGIKNTSSPAGNVGERARRRPEIGLDRIEVADNTLPTTSYESARGAFGFVGAGTTPQPIVERSDTGVDAGYA
jgi:hypothetical protein